MTNDEYLSMRERLFRIVEQLPPPLSVDDIELIREYVDANEFGLAVETIVDALFELNGRIGPGLGAELGSLTTQMSLDDRVQRRLLTISEK